MERTHLSTDVVIIGGGLADLNAALGAAERGVKVLVVDKGKIERKSAGIVGHAARTAQKGLSILSFPPDMLSI